MRTRFQQGLDDLRQRLLRMGGLAEQAVDRARQAYVERDLTRCQMVLEGESMINTAEREIDEALALYDGPMRAGRSTEWLDVVDAAALECRRGGAHIERRRLAHGFRRLRTP